uniref:Small ribosomal subunit protein uS3c n=1 Tax=Euglena gracilis var. bacillaris TaxID=158060 RepID=A0A0G3VQW5_EUGGR|nr:ribosomal protein S3 [Euglena gracilis var. bacillaris]
MGQKVHPLGFRLGITKSHSSFWYVERRHYASFVKEDIVIRNFMNKELLETLISLIKIERIYEFSEQRINTIVYIHVARPERVIGRDGQGLSRIRDILIDRMNYLLGKTPRIITCKVVGVTSPNLDARLLADSVRRELEKRTPFIRAMKTVMLQAMKAGAEGIKVQVSGRLNGIEIARTEWFREGRVPLHTLRADIDYFNDIAHTIYGVLGIKVWVYKV